MKIFHALKKSPILRWWDKEDYALLAVTSLWLLVVFGGYDFQRWLLGLFHYYGTLEVSKPLTNDLLSWLPLSYRVAEGNLFPTLPSIDPTHGGFSFYPYLTLWIHGTMIWLFGVPVSFLIGHTAIPLCCYLLLFSIFKRSIPALWSSFLGFLALISFTDLPFRDFIINLMSGTLIGTSQPPEILHFPIPALSLLAFLFVFRLSIDPVKLTNTRLTAISLMWALQSQIHVYNAIVGLLFWFLYFPTRVPKRSDIRARSFAFKILGQIAIVALTLAPSTFAYLNMETLSHLSFFNFGPIASSSAMVDAFYFKAYFILPIGLSLLIFFFPDVDPYEFFHRFWPVYSLMFAELLILTSNKIVSFAVAPELVFSRLGLFFLHFYYLVPVIYFCSRPLFASREEQTQFWPRFRSFVHWVFNSASRIYLPILMGLLSFFVLWSQRTHFQNYLHQTQPTIRAHWAQLNLLTEGVKRGEGVVSDEPIVNLLVPIATKQSTLWVNRFSNSIPKNDAIERLALYGKLMGWSEKQFLEFLTPRKESGFQVSKEHIVRSGVGYWLVMHKAPSEQFAELAMQAKSQYRDINITEALDKFNVKRILSKNKLPEQVPFTRTKVTKLGTLYYIGADS